MNKKKVVSLILSLITVLLFLPLNVIAAFAEDDITYTSGDWQYKLSKENAVIVRYIGSDTDITIPSKLGKYNVASVTYDTFYKCDAVKSITIIDDRISLTGSSFKGLPSLESIIVADNNTQYTSVDGVLFNKEKTRLIRYPAGKTSTTYNIPDSVTEIGSSAFYGCQSLYSIIIPDSVTEIGSSAFYGCKSLNSIIIPGSVSNIGPYAFALCINLENITIPDGVIGIGEYAFRECLSLESITIPNSVTSIGRSAFSSCHSLAFIKLSNAISMISDGMFFECSSLLRITIPSKVTSIGYNAFHLCSSLISIKIPNRVTFIGTDAFRDCKQLASITLPYCIGIMDRCALPSSTAIYGYAGTPAQKYAQRCGNIFVDIEKNFLDVTQKQWYFDVVKYVSRRELITGYGNGKFGPNDSLKRQDFVVILARIAGADLSSYDNKTSKLKDIKQGSYYASAVNWAVDMGYISGYTNGKFGVNDPITREQVCTILYRYMKSPGVTSHEIVLAPFSDSNKISIFAKDAIVWAIKNGVISGKNETTIAPTVTASRAEISSIVMRMDQKGMFD